MLDSWTYAIGMLPAHVCLLIPLLFAKASSHTKCIEINEHGRNAAALPFRILHSSVGVSFFFFFFLLEAVSQSTERKYLIKWSSTGKLIYFSVRIWKMCQNTSKKNELWITFLPPSFLSSLLCGIGVVFIQGSDHILTVRVDTYKTWHVLNK